MYRKPGSEQGTRPTRTKTVCEKAGLSFVPYRKCAADPDSAEGNGDAGCVSLLNLLGKLQIHELMPSF